ncbi:MAG: NAD(P)/FAD-dependent oxidoreductase [Gammaproteobacteria bacterium]|nr:NAD(P)/FAD-dependent oxidoreductase [Gammaproteobacteria bacterium]
MKREYSNLGFDPDQLREKYRHERDRRIRPEGNAQYRQPTEELEHLVDDPYAEPGFEREPIHEELDAVIIGGGFSGLLAGARFREAGINDFRIIEAAGDFGGTWYWNRYPGAQCDIESYCYFPLLEELGYMPKEKYSHSPEIYEHSQRIGRAFDLYEGTLFQTKVTGLRWDAESARWLLTTQRGDELRARFVVLATGVLSQPKLPGIAGVEDFQGHTFHTARWDYDYTGGDNQGDLTKLADKRVAVIGTGATAIQCVPYVGASAKQLYVFQRTPSSVDVRGNKPTDAEWVQTLEPGWQRRRRENFNDNIIGAPVANDLVNDGWTEMFRTLRSWIPTEQQASMSSREVAELTELADFTKMNGIRTRVDEVVSDARAAEDLKPWYRQFCKRPTFNDGYLPTFNRPNVTLVDTADSHGVERITANAVIANGVAHEVDCIIFATGFDFGMDWSPHTGFVPIGEDGVSLIDYWADGMKTLHGFTVSGFPNCFLMGLYQNGLSFNLTSVLDDQAKHIAYIIDELKQRGVSHTQPSREAEADWVTEIRRQALNNARYYEACTPGYYNNEGQVSDKGGGLNNEAYGPGANAFNDLMATWRAEGDLDGLELY